MTAARVYRPMFSWGPAWSAVLSCVSGAAVVAAFAADGLGRWIALPIAVFIFLPGVAVTICIPSMKYTLDQDKLVLTCGFVFTATIRVEDIDSVDVRDMVPIAAAACRWPGFALYSVGYRDEGEVRMCATRAARSITLITTRQGVRYGVTPEDREQFLGDLDRRRQRL